ncbi:MAG: cytochrome c biogenesis protein CcsA [Planctomycetota bacterium]
MRASAVVTLLLVFFASGTVAAESDGAARPDAPSTAWSGFGKPAAPSTTWSEETIRLLETLPVQDGGRLKPFHTYARYKLLGMNGKTKVEIKYLTDDQEVASYKITATQWLLDTLFTPEVAKLYPIFSVRNDAVLTEIQVGHAGRKKADRYSYAQIEPGREHLRQKMLEIREINPEDRDTVQTQIFELGSSFFSYEGLLDAVAGIASDHVRGREFAIIPPPATREQVETWGTPNELRSAVLRNARGLEREAGMLATLGEVARQPLNVAVVEPKLRELHGAIVARAKARGEYGKIELEVSFYNAAWFHWGLGFFAIGFVLVAFTWLAPRLWPLYWGSMVVTLVAVIVTTIGITQRCIIRGRPPVNTLYETILFVAATAALTALIVEMMNRRRIALSAAAIMGLGGLFLAMKYEALDGGDTFAPLVAVLRTNFWLATHVTTVTLGYSAGLLAAVVAHVYVIGRLFVPAGGDGFFKPLGRMIYGIIAFGLFFSVLGTILGGIWANDSWGRFWGWDPKENGALMIVLWELAMLHARRGRYIGDFGFAMASVFGGIIVVFSWWGVNLLNVGLHTYGFTSGIQLAVWVTYGALFAVLALGGIAWVRMLIEEAARPAETGD